MDSSGFSSFPGLVKFTFSSPSKNTVKCTDIVNLHMILFRLFSDLILDDLVYTGNLEHDNKNKLREVLLKHHRHQNDKQRRKSKPGLGSRKPSTPVFDFSKKFEGITGSKSVPGNIMNVNKPVTEAQRSVEFPHLPSAVELVNKDACFEECENANVCIEKVG